LEYYYFNAVEDEGGHPVQAYIAAVPTKDIRVQLSTYKSFQNKESVIQTQKLYVFLIEDEPFSKYLIRGRPDHAEDVILSIIT
jgi:hypothetical protein